MPAIRISDLADNPHRAAAAIQRFLVRGQRTGEKLYEELMNEEETRRIFELGRRYFCRPPRNEQNRELATSPYIK